jgi:type I restriction enzyme S subunit
LNSWILEGHFGLASITKFQTFEPRLPPTPDEQLAVSCVRCDMDAELTALESRRDKIRALEQGMMQKLLTGRTRLV